VLFSGLSLLQAQRYGFFLKLPKIMAKKFLFQFFFLIFVSK
jgi:hypothetical protein